MRKDDVTRDYFNLRRMGLIFLSLLMVMASSNAFAHKVNIFAYVEGDMVYTESYFPDGRKVEGGIVEVYDGQGNKLLDGKTDKEGQFNFKLPKKDDLKIVLVASMGHKNSYTLSASEMPDSIGAEKAENPEPQESKVQEVAQVDLDQIKKIVDSSLDEKLKPIMRQLTKAQQKEISFTEVIGGIGYIFGIMGIIMYFSSKKREKKS